MLSSPNISLSRRLRLSRPVRKPPSGPWCTGAAAEGVGSMLPLRGTNAVWAKSMRRTSTKQAESSVGGADMSSDLEPCISAELRVAAVFAFGSLLVLLSLPSALARRSRESSRIPPSSELDIFSQLHCTRDFEGEETAETGVDVMVDFLASLGSS